MAIIGFISSLQKTHYRKIKIIILDQITPPSVSI